MAVLLSLVIALTSAASSPDAVSIRADLQGLYDEISQAPMQFFTESDIDTFHQVMYTDDWTWSDAAGHARPWTELRDEQVQSLNTPHHDAMVQSIQKLTLQTDGVTILVNVTIVRTVVDNEGRYGAKGAKHTLNETTPYRDTWVAISDHWKMKSRQQAGAPKIVVDKPDYEP
jgi:hypothetical protein